MEKMTRKQYERQVYEDDFYERWNKYLPVASDQDLENLRERLEDINSAYPETMLWIKTMVLTIIDMTQEEKKEFFSCTQKE